MLWIVMAWTVMCYSPRQLQHRVSGPPRNSRNESVRMLALKGFHHCEDFIHGTKN